MACSWFERRWQAALDARRDPSDDEVLAGHADECCECGEWLEAQRMLFEALACCGPRGHDGTVRARRTMVPACGLEPPAKAVPRVKGWSTVGATAALALLAILLVSLIAVPPSPRRDPSSSETGVGWRATVAEWSAASGRWLATNVAPVRSAARMDGGQTVPQSELSAWEFHWVARVGYSLAATESPPVEHIEELAGTIRPLATTMYRVVETLRPKWQSVAPPLSPERERQWEQQWEQQWDRQWGEPFRDGPREAPQRAGERNSVRSIDRARMV